MIRKVIVLVSLLPFLYACGGLTETDQKNDNPGNIITAHTLTGDETWSGTVNVTGTVTIPAGTTLTIQPGTVVAFTPADRDETGWVVYGTDIGIMCSGGSLIANGTADNLIVFTSAAEAPQFRDWKNIGIMSGIMELRYCCIAYAETGVFIYSDNASAPVVEHCLFQTTGGIVDFGGDFSMEYNSFLDCEDGYRRWGNNASTTITSCEFIRTARNIEICGIATNTTTNAAVHVSTSNFITAGAENFLYHFYMSDNYVSYSTIGAIHSFFDIAYMSNLGSGINNNTVGSTEPALSAVIGAGCGFEKPSSVRSLPFRGSSRQEAVPRLSREESMLRLYEENVQASGRSL